MAARKIKDIAVKVGEYDDRQTGQKKNRYQNVGALMKNEDGSVFILIERTFNPAGAPDNGRGTVLLSCFDLRDKDDNGGGGENGNAYANAKGKTQPAPAHHGLDDEIPF